MRRSPLLALILLPLPVAPARAAKTFVNRSGSAVGLQLHAREGSLGYVEARVIRAPAPPGHPKVEHYLFPLNPLNPNPVPGPIRLGHGDALEFQIRTERHWAPGKVGLALDLFTFNVRRPWDERECQGEYLRVTYSQRPSSGEGLQGVRLVPADGSEEDVFHRFKFRCPEDGKADLELVAAAPGWCVIL